MKTDNRLSDAIFRGDTRAFSEFLDAVEGLFMAHITRRFHYSKSKGFLEDVFQDSSLELWSQIINGKMTREKLTVDLSTYLVSIGVNKFMEESRNRKRRARLKDDLPIRRKKKEEEIPDDGQHPIQSIKAQREANTNINLWIYESTRPKDLPNSFLDELTPEQKEDWKNYVLEKVRAMDEPCRSVLRDTWWNNLSDEEIMDNSNGFYNTISAVKTRRFRCHKKLQTVLQPRFEALMC